LGFNNTYALALRMDLAEEKGISKISDLLNHSSLRAGFTHEFFKRNDGYDALSKRYGLNLRNIKLMEHSLIFQSLYDSQLDLIEVYSTDAKVKKYRLKILTDDLNFFPNYQAVIFYREGFAKKYPKSFAALEALQGKINQQTMIELNAKAELEHWSFDRVAQFFLKKEALKNSFPWSVIGQRTLEHLSLVFLSLLLALIAGLPLGYFAVGNPSFGNALLLITGLFQTVPSLALLCFLIPIFGIGYTPSVIALFLYALLPIVRNTYLGFSTIDARLIESASTLGLSFWHRLYRIEIPLASPSILAGVKLSAVINVGTATLAAFVGAGGYGAMIVTGLALNDSQLILQGAIPSALMAIMVHIVFEFLDQILIPEGLRKTTA
jgi:osmoprotectant transport system permease protein